MKVAWGITGAGHFLKESFEIFVRLKQVIPGLKVSTFTSKAGEEVLKMYGLFEKINQISGGDYLEEFFLESRQGASSPKTGRFMLGKYDCLIVSPATSNTVAKIVHGIADTPVTNAVALAVKGNVPVYILPVDIAGSARSRMPYSIDRELCLRCEVCPPEEQCPQGAITGQVDLLKCNGCGECVRLCPHGAIKGGEVIIRIRDIDVQNVKILRGLEGITVIETPEDIMKIIYF